MKQLRKKVGQCTKSWITSQFLGGIGHDQAQQVISVGPGTKISDRILGDSEIIQARRSADSIGLYLPVNTSRILHDYYQMLTWH